MPPLSIMIKPASALCNMRCKYCFYHDVTDHRDVKSFGMISEETTDNLIAQIYKINLIMMMLTQIIVFLIANQLFSSNLFTFP